MSDIVRKNGLLLSSDLKTVIGIDEGSGEFTGKVPYGVTCIGEEAFSCCELSSIELPDTVVEIRSNAFGNCQNLEKVTLPSNLAEFPPYMFYCCTALKEIPFRGGIEVLPEGFAYGCTSLKSVVIPDCVKEVSKNAFSNCENLSSVVLPAELMEFDFKSIINCPNLSHIRISEENPYFCTNEEGTVLFRINEDGEKEEIFEVSKLPQVNLPEFNEISEEQASSILSYDEMEDDGDEDLNIFATEEEAIVIEKGIDSGLSQAGESSDIQNYLEMYNNGTAVDAGTENESINENEPESVAEEAPSDASIDALMAEILGQNKMYGDGDFGINDIPEASEEEKEASSLALSQEELNAAFARPVVDAVQEEPVVEESVMEEPVMDQPLMDESVQQEVISEPVMNEPVMNEPIMEQNVETACEECAADEPEFSVSAQDTEEESFDFPVENSVEDRLAEIMAQGQMFGDTVFSINDIPEASEEEKESDCLAHKEEDSQEISVPTMKITVPVAADESTMEDRLNQIMEQDKAFSQFSIMDIPAASEEELAADRILDDSENLTPSNAMDSIAEEPDFKPEEEMLSETVYSAGNDEIVDDRMFMQNLCFESTKIEQKRTDISSLRDRILYVFTEKLEESELGPVFGSRLTKLCNRLAGIHGFTSIYYFNGTRVDTEKFKVQLTKFMADKDVVYSTSAGVVSQLSEEAKILMDCIGVGYTKDRVLEQSAKSRVASSSAIKLLLSE